MSESLRGHPLVGRIWDSHAQGFGSPEQVVTRVLDSRFVLLGEKHDNADHHRLQAWLIRELAERGRRPSVAVEMISADQASALEVQGGFADVESLAEALAWEESGWPEFAIYRPIFQAVQNAHLSLHAANLSRSDLGVLREDGLSEWDSELVARFSLESELSPEIKKEIAEEIRKAHCGYAPEGMVEVMIRIQRARDAVMAAAMLDNESANGSLLIAGKGHTRRDRGVPAYLAMAQTATITSVAFIEVGLDSIRPQDYPQNFDFLWFTPRVDEADPCEKFRDQLKHMRPES